MSEKMDKEVFCFAPESAFSFSCSMMEILFPVCTLTWRVNNSVSHQGKGINCKNESTKGHTLIH